jgi:hypothetical protein
MRYKENVDPYIGFRVGVRVGVWIMLLSNRKGPHVKEKV